MLGWGFHGIESGVPITSPRLHKAIVPAINYEQCREIIAEHYPPGVEDLGETTFCTGPIDGNIAFCDGDNGGPLVENLGGNWLQVGIMSWSGRNCGIFGGMSVHVAVHQFVDWINANINSTIF